MGVTVVVIVAFIGDWICLRLADVDEDDVIVVVVVGGGAAVAVVADTAITDGVIVVVELAVPEVAVEVMVIDRGCST